MSRNAGESDAVVGNSLWLDDCQMTGHHEYSPNQKHYKRYDTQYTGDEISNSVVAFSGGNPDCNSASKRHQHCSPKRGVGNQNAPSPVVPVIVAKRYKNDHSLCHFPYNGGTAEKAQNDQRVRPRWVPAKLMFHFRVS